MVKSNVKSSDKLECSNVANYIARDMSYYYDYEYNSMITTLLLAVRTAELNCCIWFQEMQLYY